MKKIKTITLALILTLGLCAPAFAARSTVTLTLRFSVPVKQVFSVAQGQNVSDRTITQRAAALKTAQTDPAVTQMTSVRNGQTFQILVPQL